MEVSMEPRKMMSHQEVMDYLHSQMTPEEQRAADKGGFWAIADVFVRTFGYQVKSKREALGMTQMELADYSGIQQKEISKIERGIGNPTLKTCQQLLSALGLELRVLEVEASTTWR
jgi:DNA-binding XRE family transcriptional regulator